MIIKMTNNDEKFYQYMGRIFGSRIIERETNDRIYDDNNKDWYIYIEEEKVLAFVSVSKNIIKNIYTTKKEYLNELLNEIKKENIISNSIVTKTYIDIYKQCGFKIEENSSLKNFVTIYSNTNKGGN